MAVDPTDEIYNSASDEDFNPANVLGNDDTSLSSKDQSPILLTQKHRSTSESYDSGDEALLQNLPKLNRASTSHNDSFASKDDASEGGFVKTRAQRRLEEKESGSITTIHRAKVDVDEVWRELISEPLYGRTASASNSGTAPQAKDDNPDAVMTSQSMSGPIASDYITTDRSYEFAGEHHTEVRRIRKDSAEACFYLSSQSNVTKLAEKTDGSNQTMAEKISHEPHVMSPTKTATTPTNSICRRPLRRPSRFDPNPSGIVKTLPPDKQLFLSKCKTRESKLPLLDTSKKLQRKSGMSPKAEKLNTVAKSRHDWAGYVKKEGIASELDEYGKAKEGYLGRMEFLKNVEARCEEDRREAKNAS